MIKIIYITESGKKLAEKIKCILDHYKYNSKIFHIKNFSIDEGDEGYIFISAIGIVLRKYIDKIKNDKFTDSFVIVCNEKKEFIPILSNHLGRGNYFSKLIANNINGKTIFTTATDVHGKVGLDELSNILFLEKPNRKDILEINKRLLEENIDLKLPYGWKIKLNGYDVEYHDKDLVIIDNRIKLRPLKIVVGIGARRGVKRYKVYWAIKKALYLRSLYPWRISAFSTIENKRDEIGILEVVNKFKKPFLIFDKDEINKLYNIYDLEKSDFIFKNINVYGVAEPCSILGVKKLTNVDYNKIYLMLKKIKYDGVTIAISTHKEF
ncbi:cobalamin (vitamin B12) biosynthesis CbiG protein [Methanocaldococcus villosus KIN24-T80]|uniref:Cobalamin (Vitamin B12) biosynthesis CbiG protein n=1 Tax=Methanocaldococcus villosus KIN24-T80 TaxID=1069083 RepID=N6VXA2_9EURY|nr:cobalamin biosynthesis protein [Methanocaldococcus villosus]ENN95747.1 cobalamin (vitamin B12) biosynthesis CbiG protein [Methanocaldococcus villosus KIN24-T80]